MKISGSGMARNGINAVKCRKNLYDARAAIAGFHDALLAVAKGMLTPEEVKDFFWSNDLDEAKFIGGVVEFKEQKNG